MAKVSVIIPVYGVEKYIENCSKQLFEQTLDDIEFLFVDDCTPDNSINVLKKVLDNYPYRKHQVRIHRMEHNSGQAKVREWGMRNATGDYLIHCDSDDSPDSQQYETMYYTALREAADLVFCDFTKVYPDGTRISVERNCNFDNKLDLFGKIFAGYHSLNPLWCCLMKRDLIQNLIYPKGNQGEDRVIMVQALYYSKKISYIHKSLYDYYITPNSIQRTNTPEKSIERALHLLENVTCIESFLKDKNLYNIFHEEFVSTKFEPRILLSSCLHEKRCRDAWYYISPDINSQILSNKYISKSSKFKEIIMRLHLGMLYGYFYRIIKKQLII